MSTNNIIERVGFAAGANIMKEGDEAYNAYLLQSGRARVYTVQNGKKVELSLLNPGEIFGETSLVMNAPRTASVEAIENCTVVVIRREDFKKRLRNSDPAIRAVVDVLTKRITHSNAEIVKSKGVNVDNFIKLLNQIFGDLLEAMPLEDKESFQNDAFPILGELITVIEKYRDKL